MTKEEAIDKIKNMSDVIGYVVIGIGVEKAEPAIGKGFWDVFCELTTEQKRQFLSHLADEAADALEKDADGAFGQIVKKTVIEMAHEGDRVLMASFGNVIDGEMAKKKEDKG